MPSTVTIIIPCFNASHFVRQAVESCIQQQSPPQQIILIDDGSTDKTGEILKEYATRENVALVQNEKNLGKVQSLNRAIEGVTTTYTVLLDADDVCEPNRLNRQVAFMDADPRIGCSSSFVNYINRHGRQIAKGRLDLLSEQDLERYLKSDKPFGLFGPAVILRTEVFRDPNLRFRTQFWPGEDIDLWNRIAEAGWKVLAQPEFLVKYRIHSHSSVTQDARKSYAEYEFVKACLRARRSRLPEPSREEFKKQIEALPLVKRINRSRKIEAKAAYREAGFAYGEKRFLHFIAALIRGLCLQPSYVLRRLARNTSKS